MDKDEEVVFRVVESDEYTLIHFELNNVITPDILKRLNPPKVDNRKGIVLSGRGPIWFYCYLTHFYHPTKFIAVYDPRIGGAIIVETHSTNYVIGDVLKITSEY